MCCKFNLAYNLPPGIHSRLRQTVFSDRVVFIYGNLIRDGARVAFGSYIKIFDEKLSWKIKLSVAAYQAIPKIQFLNRLWT